MVLEFRDEEAERLGHKDYPCRTALMLFLVPEREKVAEAFDDLGQFEGMQRRHCVCFEEGKCVNGRKCERVNS